jgi:hypothetical protein
MLAENLRMHISRLAAARAILLAISAVMAWEALFPATFTSIVKRPYRDLVELSYFGPIVGSVVFVGITVYHLIRRRGRIESAVVSLVFTVLWCLGLALCFILMMARTGI